MALTNNSVIGLHNGVSTQALELRPNEMVEELINCYPSIHSGLRRRNPTQQLSSSMLVEDNQFLYSYDRGLSGDLSEQYLITVDRTNGLRVFDIVAGEYKTVTYSGVAQKYLESSNFSFGFSAITVQDTTFLCNREIIPRMVGDTTSDMDYSQLNISLTGITSSVEIVNSVSRDNVLPIVQILSGSTSYVTEINHDLVSGMAPARFKIYKGEYEDILGSPVNFYSMSSIGAKITVTIDTVPYVYTVATTTDAFNVIPETVSSMRTNLYSMLMEKLDPSQYVVRLDSNQSIVIGKVDGTTIAITTDVTFPTSVDAPPPSVSTLTKIAIQSTLSIPLKGTASYTLKDIAWSAYSEENLGSTIFSAVTTGQSAFDSMSVSDYDKKAFIWIQQVSVDTAFPYTFTVVLKELNGTTIASTTSNATTSTGVASALSTWADGLAGFTSSVKGSTLLITRDNGSDFLIEVSDTYGNQASSSWKGLVSQMSDLPKAFGFIDTIVKVDGVQRNDDAAYWVKYDGKTWVEWRDPNAKYAIDSTTMPHKLVRNADFTFTLSPVSWDNMLVGDSKTQTTPNFIGSPIKDMFFVNGRLGFLTKNGINLSQVNVVTNFFRTTILTLLDDSPICTFIDSSKSVGLEYASELQGSVVLFGNKQQFILSAEKAISPSTIQVQPISGYEIKKNIKPISLNDNIVFAVSKGNYTAVMQMNRSTLNSNVKADDTSAHINGYIPDDVKQLVASPRNDVLFITTYRNKNTIYFYKFYDQNSTRVQSAWSKWVFNVNIASIFCFDRNIYIFGKRYSSTVPVETATFVKTVKFSKEIVFDSNITFGEFASAPTFEVIDIEPYAIDAVFKDNGTVRYDSEVELSEWRIKDRNGLKDMSGTLLLKTIDISSNGGSLYNLQIFDKERRTYRSIPSQYVVGRRPFISGRTENTRIKILSTNGNGFQINSITVESQYNTRSKKI